MKHRGFTLIELLVVISIIGLLASVVLLALNNARSKGRDAKRLADMHQLQNALELYFSDNGSYPVCGGNPSCTSTGAVGNGDIKTLGVVPSYMAAMSYDPTNIDGQYGYYYVRGYRKTGGNTFAFTGVATDYIIATRVENASNPQAVATFAGWNNSFLNYLAGN